MGNICIIPARGGSKRIPRKNVKDFLGKPIIAYSIQAAIESELFDEIMVSTDDHEIADIAINFGAKVPFLRSVNNSNDFATTYQVIEEVIKDYKRKLNLEFEYFCCLYSCAPFVTPNTLKLAYNKLIIERFDTVFPILAFSFPIQRALGLEKGKVKMINDRYLSTRSQDLENRYHDAGQFYWGLVEQVLREKKLFNSNTGGIIISELEAQDIDTYVDWKLAELKYQLKE
ncbi:pseudaminic acid cytidylyltransferase [Polaribacter porphyrae]|uniref:Pseudaminic acid cytidylyltransferase n=1 Tax=Polaribacter porphyrae TaxID=1137780 RepID=A0A2S7WJH0_9FLAO|nr:pseudaminic acid cytidylyltransferase [Polaribacter porphyrae]PQJ77757.1 pseudaminic acid cytidylyltransferase [Polaribacter porphyrae]